ncbi:MAG: hypothetical protein ACXWXN_10190 [Actinomycetota bacterium]
MKNLARYALVLTVIATLGLTLAAPAVAGQRISYRGRTSQDERVRLEVLKRDSGRRFLRDVRFFMTLTCDDASTMDFGIGFGIGRRLGDDGSFGLHDLYTGMWGLAIDIDGVVLWGSAEGTLEISAAGLTEDGGDATFCTTGPVDWTADRVSSRPARPLSAPDGVTMVRIDRDGELRVIEP